VGVALDVPAAREGWLSSELSCSPGSLLAVWLETGLARRTVSGVPLSNAR
jgi:hypothetical protein